MPARPSRRAGQSAHRAGSGQPGYTGRHFGRLAIALVAVFGAIASGLATAGCARMDAALGKQWVVVVFQQNTPVPEMLHVRQACSHVPNVRMSPLPAKPSQANMVDTIRYDTTNASLANITQLQQCLRGFKNVAGMSLQDATDMGA